ncbi:MAG: tripartite tricarboxylate transporter TctB family protein [Burkholderiaceae bacterium]
MSRALNDSQRDLLLGAVAGAFAVLYIGASRAIEDSLLADAVGAGGVPQAVGLALLLAALALLVKSWLERTAAPPSSARAQADAPPTAAAPAQPRLRLSAALVALLVAYALLLPWLGYILSVSLFVLGVALLAGAPRRSPLAWCTALSGVSLWAMFDLALQIRMPMGWLFS